MVVHRCLRTRCANSKCKQLCLHLQGHAVYCGEIDSFSCQSMKYSPSSTHNFLCLVLPTIMSYYVILYKDINGYKFYIDRLFCCSAPTQVIRLYCRNPSCGFTPTQYREFPIFCNCCMMQLATSIPIATRKTRLHKHALQRNCCPSFKSQVQIESCRAKSKLTLIRRSRNHPFQCMDNLDWIHLELHLWRFGWCNKVCPSILQD